MNKKEFLNALTKKLKLLPKEDREDAISFYTEFLEDSGFNDTEDVTGKIGTPKQVASELIANCTKKHIDENEEKKSPKKTARIVWLAIISIFSLPITLPLAIALLIIVLTLIIVLIVLFIAFAASAIAVAVAGVGLIIAGFFAPGIGQKLVCAGIGLITLAIGVLILFVTILIYVLLIRLFVSIIKKNVEKRKK